MGAGDRKARAESTKEKLLEAGLEVFAEKGFEGARVEEIARRAGVNIRMLYHHFRSKEGLFLKVVEGMHKEIQARQDAVFRTEAPPFELLTQAIEDLFDFLGRNPSFVKILGWLSLSGGRRGPLPEVGKDYALRVVRPRMEELARSGAWNGAVDPLFAILMCWSLSVFWFLNRGEFHSMVEAGTPLEKDRAYLDQVLALLEGGLLGKSSKEGRE